MGFKGTSTIPEDYDREARDFFEKQLRRIDLANDQIAEQDLRTLEVSLIKVNDAIANPGSFATFKISLALTGGVIVTRLDSQGSIEIGILPLLLERKGQILERIAALRPEQQLSEIRDDVAARVQDPIAREQVIEMIDHRFEEQRSAREDLAREQAKVEAARARAKEREMQLRIKMSESKAAIYRSFLERESIASIVGAILLVILGVTLIVGMFVHVAASDVISNAFLLILGYFFGTAVIRERPSRL